MNNDNGYHDLSVTDLRRLVRERGLANGAAVVSARRDDLLALLDGRPVSAGNDAGTLPAPTMMRTVSSAASTVDSGIGAMVAGLVRDAVDAEIAARAAELRPTVTINLGETRAVTLPEGAHPALAKCIRRAHAGLPILLVGPAGSGKTTLSEQIAAALGRGFTFNSMSAGVTESSILGRILPDASGAWSYHASPFVHAYRTGGVHLFDEIDAADANLLVTLNAALANGHISIPFAQLEPIKRHGDFLFIGAANTFGRGADRQYVGRNALDAATLDRFAVSTIHIDYDAPLERALAENICGVDRASTLLAWAHSVRDCIGAHKLRRVMSTRTIVNAAKRLAIGDTLDEISSDYLAGWSDDECAKIGGAR